MRSLFFPLLSATCCLALLLSGCAPETPPDPPDTPPDPASSARFEDADCPADTPAGLVEGESVRCGRLVVPQDRARADSPTLSLAVMILRGTKDPEPDPLVYLIGGPGGTIAGNGDALADFGLEMSRRTNRDLIVFDQRGTGASMPFLECGAGESLPDCAARLAEEGIDLFVFNTEESAADVEDLRVALGLEEINLYGQSYGSILGQTVMRLYPAGVRSVVLESVSAVAHDACFTLSPRSFELALGRVIAGCEADAACAAAFPDLDADLTAIVEQAEAAGKSPAQLFAWMAPLLELADGTSYVPLLLHAMATGDSATMTAVGEVIDKKNALVAGLAKGFSPIMYLAMSCYDYGPLLTEEQDEKVNGGAPAYLREAFSTLDLAPICPALPPSRTSDAMRQPVTSDLPTLLLSGAHDNNTPREIAAQVASELGNAHHVTIEGYGHVLVGFQSECALDVLEGFVLSPSAPPSAPCLTSQKTVFPTAAP
jgi:pimeloyl-ACP methyl ester carboxylesterase